LLHADGIVGGRFDLHPIVQAFARFERDHMPAATPTPVSAAVEERAREGVEPELIERLLDAQQDINLAANVHMDQSLCDASALIDEIEPILRAALTNAQPIRAGVLTVAAYNDLYDPANEAGQDTFGNGFREGFLYAKFPEGYDESDAEEAMRQVDDIAMGEAWEAYRDEFLRRLPIAAVPDQSDIGKPAALATPDDALTERASVIEECAKVADKALGDLEQHFRRLAAIARRTLECNADDARKLDDTADYIAQYRKEQQ
jgi:hypothetical protein